ncbi:MAG: patatin-like phospholipase family protein [Coriobacteriia bacterium]|nr:patatin-like phospholipase family protein [Coriobacteriia bacterium]
MSWFGPKRIGLALGSGAARGLAHIGVLKLLEAEGLRPDVITGTSMGALVGAFYAAGIPVDEIEQIAREFDIRTVTGVGEVALSRGAMFSGTKVQEFLRAYLPETFEELRMPFGCVATDIAHNVPVRFDSGDLVSAVRASVSVPLAFVPVRMGDMLLVDGYICDPLPVGLARHLGGQVIVGVDVSGAGTVGPLPPNGEIGTLKLKDLRSGVRTGTTERGTTGLDVLGAISESFERRLVQQALRLADVVVSPDVSQLTGIDYGHAAFAISEGESAMGAAVQQLRRKARRPAPVQPDRMP